MNNHRALQRFQATLEIPMIVLAFVWLALFVFESVKGGRTWLTAAGWIVWACFLIEFAVGFVLARSKGTYLRKNWLKAIALAAPALRVFRLVRLVRVARFARLARGARMLRIVSSLNRGMRALGVTFGRRGAPYVVALTVLVTFAGAAGMYAFEGASSNPQGFNGFADALWWTAMIMTTMGSAYWPETAAGRILCVLLALYAFAVFGYVTALLASFFVGRDAAGAEPADRDMAKLTEEVRRMRLLVEQLAGHDGPSPPAGEAAPKYGQ